MGDSVKRQEIYKTSFKSYLKAMFVFFVFFLICSFTFFFYIKEDIVNESVDKVLMNTEKQTESLKEYINIQYRYLE